MSSAFVKIFMTLRSITISRLLLFIAAILWFSSLFTPVFSFYNGKILQGYQVFLSGWLSPICFNFAWYANVFLIYAFFKLLFGKKASVSSIIAGIISLDTFRYIEYLADEGGGSFTLYGYGCGSILWFLSISLIITSAGFRKQEEKNYQKNCKLNRLSLAGIVLFTVILSSSIYFSIHDRMIANAFEKKRLKGIAFKRFKVCSAKDPIVLRPIKNFTTLELVCKSNKENLCDVRQLLTWGIPTVRYQNIDYSYEDNVNMRDLISVPSKGESSATLYVEETSVVTSFFLLDTTIITTIHAKLLDSDGNIVFDQIWKEGFECRDYCPQYDDCYPDKDTNPRKLLIEALNIVELSKKDKAYDAIKLKGKIIKFSQEGLPTEIILSKWKAENPNSKLPYKKMVFTANSNCPNDIDWGSYKSNNIGQPLTINKKSYYFNNNYDATCADKYIYLYKGSSSFNNYYLFIEKRYNSDLKFKNNYLININDIPEEAMNEKYLCDGYLRMESVNETKEAFYFDLVNKRTGEMLTIEAQK